MLPILSQAAYTLLAATLLSQTPGARDSVEGWENLAPLLAGQASLELRLTAVRDVYPLEKRSPETKTQTERGAVHPAPVVVVFHLKNTGKTPLVLRGSPEPSLELRGPDGKALTPFEISVFFVAPRNEFTLAPGETLRLPMHQLAFHRDRSLLALSWITAGEHQLQGEFVLAIRNTGVATIASNSIKLHIETGDELPYWLKALEDRSGDVRLAAAKYLKVIEPVEAALTAGLTKALEQERESNITVALIQALERLGPRAKDAGAVLRRQLTSADLGVRGAAIAALAHIGPKDKAVVKDLLPLLQDPHAQVRRTLAEHLSTLLHNESSLVQPDVVAALRQAVAREPDDVALSYIIRSLGKVPEPAVIRDLLPHVENELLTKHREEAIAALGSVIFWMPPEKRKTRDEQNSPIAATVAALVKILRDNDPARSTAIYALMQIGPDAAPAVPLLIAEVKKPGKKGDWNSDRLYAVRALGAIGPGAKAAVAVLVEKGLTDENWQLRESAVTALGRIKNQPNVAVPALVKMLSDEREIVAARAFEALAEFGPDGKKAIPALLALLNDSKKVNAAAATLVKIGIAGEKTALAPLLKAASTYQDRELMHIATLLGQLGPDAQQALPILRKLADHRDGFVLIAARAAIKRIEKR